jgi:hypothetical protein
MKWIIVAAMLVAASAWAQSKPPTFDQGALVWSAFACSIYAELSGYKNEQDRLFILGVEVGRSWLKRFEERPPTHAERNNMPIGILLRMPGPSVDFVLGRIFEAVADDAFDKVVKHDNSGLYIADPAKWADDELRKVRAEQKYRAGNCALIR